MSVSSLERVSASTSFYAVKVIPAKDNGNAVKAPDYSADRPLINYEQERRLFSYGQLHRDR